MHILWVKMGGLWPSTTGGRVRSLQIVSELARRHQVTVVTTHGPGDDPEGLKRQLSHCHEVVSLPVQPSEAGKRRVPGRRRAVVDVEIPGGSLEMARAAGAAARCGRSSTAARSTCASATFCLPRPTCRPAAPRPVVLFEHNVEYMIWQRLCALETQPVAPRAVRDRMAEAARARSRRVPAKPT